MVLGLPIVEVSFTNWMAGPANVIVYVCAVSVADALPLKVKLTPGVTAITIVPVATPLPLTVAPNILAAADVVCNTAVAILILPVNVETGL